MDFDFLVVGGGIAGVSCTEQLASLAPDSRIALVSATSFVKSVVNFKQVATILSDFDVVEKESSCLSSQFSNVSTFQARLVALDPEQHVSTVEECLGTEKRRIAIKYKKLCLCMGAKPKIIFENSHVIGIRDTESVKTFQEKLKKAERVLIVGNGGIATELAYEIGQCHVVWVVKDSSISHVFFDEATARFFIPVLTKTSGGDSETTSGGGGETRPTKRIKYTLMKYEDPGGDSEGKTILVASKGDQSRRIDIGNERERGSEDRGAALGPDWSSGLDLAGQLKEHRRNVSVETECEIREILTPEQYKLTTRAKRQDERLDWPVYALLTNGKTYGCDFIVSATGVVPASDALLRHCKFNVNDDGGILVDHQMRTSCADVYAAGDLCAAAWKPAELWFQMRLWSQARQMGAYAAQCMVANMAGDEIPMDFCFELFAHATKYFGYKVVLLGKYNALGAEHELLFRFTDGEEFVKVVLKNGRMQGAILVGETDLEETFENLILNQMDLSFYGDSLLDPSVDIEDYFD